MPLKIGVVGAGNIGTAMAALLCRGGADVWLTARGARLERIRSEGISLNDRGTVIDANPQVTPALDTPMDAVFLCVKSQDLGTALYANRAALTPNTWVIPMVNGFPFWFFAQPGDMGDVPCVDPDGHLKTLLSPEQVLGAVLLMTVKTETSGQAVSSNTPTLSLGSVLRDTDTSLLDDLINTLEKGGVRTDISEDIRLKTIVKLLANFTTNPLSSLTGAVLDQIGTDTDLKRIATNLADEFRAWAAPLGYDLPPNDWLVDLFIDAGPFPTSMLQDTLAGKPLELDAICRAPVDLARAAGRPMPTMERLLALLETAGSLPVPAETLTETLTSLFDYEHERTAT